MLPVRSVNYNTGRMYTVEATIYVTLFTAFLDALFEKWGYWSIFKNWASMGGRKWLYDLSFCDLCKRFWVSVLITAVVALILGFKPGILAVPFLTGGVFQILDK